MPNFQQKVEEDINMKKQDQEEQVVIVEEDDDEDEGEDEGEDDNEKMEVEIEEGQKQQQQQQQHSVESCYKDLKENGIQLKKVTNDQQKPEKDALPNDDELRIRAKLLLSELKSNHIRTALINDGSLFTVDGQSFSNVARFANHSCQPNVISLPVTLQQSHGVALYSIAFFALRDIKPLEEIVYDYGQMYLNHMEHCLCGSAVCLHPPSKEWKDAHSDWPDCQVPAPTYGVRVGVDENENREVTNAKEKLKEKRKEKDMQMREERRLRREAKNISCDDVSLSNDSNVTVIVVESDEGRHIVEFISDGVEENKSMESDKI
jgi:hypothetical protein